MSVDRILQLKLLADVSDINKKTGAVTQEVGRIRGAFSGLKSFIGPVMLNIGIEAAGALMDGLMGGFAASEAWDTEMRELTGLVGDGAEEIAQQVSDISFDLGFDDAESLEAFNEFLRRTGGDVEEAMALLNASFDLSASGFGDLGAAAAEVGAIYKGESEKMAEYGISTEEAIKNSAANVDAALGDLSNSAEERAGTIEGVIDRVDVAVDRGFALAATVLTDFAENALPVLVALWEQWGPSVISVAEKFGEFVGKVVELGAVIIEKLEPVLTPLVDITFKQIETALSTLMGLFDTLILLFNGDLSGAWEKLGETMRGAFDGIVSAVKTPLNTILGAIESALNWIGNAFFSALEGIRSNLNGIAFIGDAIPDEPITWGGITVPRLAEGGIVNKPTLAVIGEAGAEAVVPLSRGGMGNTYHINFNGVVGDPAEAGRKVVDAIKRYESRAGTSWRTA